jgi:hypothetical protein
LTPRALTCAIRVSGPVPAWESLPTPVQRLFIAYFDADGHGRAVWHAANHEHDYAMWLAATSSEFTAQCGHLPADLTDQRWCRYYDAAWSPAEAARLDLHQRPRARVDDDDELVCPVCGAAGRICEEDRATRRHDLSVHRIGTGARVVVTEDDHLFEHVRYVCLRCDTTVQLPLPINHYR